MPEASISKELFDLYENECKSQAEFVAKLMKKDWGYEKAITETMAGIIWECMDITADHYFEDVE